MPTSTGAISSTVLKRFTPFNRLTNELVDMLIASIEVLQAPQGYCLFELAENSNEQFFLISGKVRLTGKDGQQTLIGAGMPNSNAALSRIIPRQHQAVAISDIEFFSVNALVLIELERSVKKPADYLCLLARKSPLDESGNALLHLFQHELMRGRFLLPSMPEVAVRVREMIDRHDCNTTELATLVASDPAIAAKLIQAANSPIYRGVSGCKDITSAITRLGLISTRQLVTSFAILGMFTSSSSTLRQHMNTQRNHCIVVATYSQAFAEQLDGFNAEEAFLAGLLHSIGTFVVISYAEQFAELDNNESMLSVLLHQLSGPVATLVMDEWGFSDNMLLVASESANWLRNNQPVIDYCDITIIAKLCALMADNAIHTLTHPSPVPAVNLLQQALSKQQITDCVTLAQHRIDESLDLFSG